MDATWIDAVTGSPWLYPALFLLVVGDAVLVILPSEISVVALGALWASTGAPPILAVAAVAGIGAIVGDSLCYAIGRAVGTDRWGWQRGPRITAAIGRVRSVVHTRTATLVFTARYIPFARIAVNLTAGASGIRYRRFLPLSAAAGLGWAAWNLAIGAAGGALLRDEPVLAVAVSIVVAIAVGVAIDLVASRSSRRRLTP